MKITILGAGSVGKALGTGWAAAGHDVVYGVRDPTKGDLPAGTRGVAVPASVQGAEVVVLAVPYWETENLLASLPKKELRGKMVLDVRNALTPDKKWARGFTTSAAEEVQKKLPGTKVIKALNTVFADAMNGGKRHGETMTSFVASDELSAKGVGMKLSTDLGLDAVDAGGLAAARMLEAVGALMVHLGAATSTGWDIGMKLVHPRT
jgi:8-hydroxy-5-deazaflavin:NADPH oxidoreductase